MPTVPLHTPAPPPTTALPNPLPQLLQTPTGLALVELQGTVNTPHANAAVGTHTPVGKLVFPLYPPADPASTAWMKRVYLYVGSHQRLTGEVRKLPKPVAVVRRREAAAGAVAEGSGEEELEIVEVVKWKILFTGRPEPVSGD